MTTIRPIEVLLVTGFLGTGKTSLIRAFLEARDTARIGIIVNEAGDTSFDGIVIAEATGERSTIRMLGNGCLCCEAADDLAQSVRDLVARHLELTGTPSECIIVEASGLARPGKLLRQFQAITDIPLRIHVVSTVDATLAADPDNHSEIAAQWAAASSLVLTRRDLARDAGERALALARAVNPLATWHVDGSARERAAAAFSALGHGTPMPSIALSGTERATHGRVRATTLLQDPAAGWDDCLEWLDNLAGIGNEQILRVKGLVSPPSAERSWLVQAVGTTFAVPLPIARVAQGHLVVIGEGMTREWFAAIEPPGTFAMPGATDAFRPQEHGHD